MTVDTQTPPIPAYVCPAWCTEVHTIGTCRDDVLHMSDTAGTSIPRYQDKGWVEFMAYLVSNIDADGTAQTPRIEVEMVGQCGLIRTRDEARTIVDELQQSADLIESWISHLPESEEDAWKAK